MLFVPKTNCCVMSRGIVGVMLITSNSPTTPALRAIPPRMRRFNRLDLVEVFNRQLFLTRSAYPIFHGSPPVGKTNHTTLEKLNLLALPPKDRSKLCCRTKYLLLSEIRRSLLLTCTFMQGQTISSPWLGALHFEAFASTPPSRIVVEPSPCGAWLLIAQSAQFSAVTFAVARCVVACAALRGFQQFTEFSLSLFRERQR